MAGDEYARRGNVSWLGVVLRWNGGELVGAGSGPPRKSAAARSVEASPPPKGLLGIEY